MKLVKSGQIANCCQPNALMTLKEYLIDYASEDTRRKGEALIREELKSITSDKIRKRAEQNLKEIENGTRDIAGRKVRRGRIWRKTGPTSKGLRRFAP